MKEFRFEAAHRLPNHDGQCRNPHGHSYLVKVFIVGDMPMRFAGHPKEGMLIDFGDVSVVAKTIISKLDHTNLNESARMHLGVAVTTAENLAYGLYKFFDCRLSVNGLRVEKVRVYETVNAYAEYEG